MRATAETATTAKTAPGSDENDDDTDTESKKRHSLDIDSQCLKPLYNATHVGTKSIPNTRFKKQQQKIRY